ncbi:MAG: hypothetical protein GY928_12810 [Colwellia sp.]|nr:hypothetical protein [Colwellia sp.]
MEKMTIDQIRKEIGKGKVVVYLNPKDWKEMNGELEDADFDIRVSRFVNEGNFKVYNKL